VNGKRKIRIATFAPNGKPEGCADAGMNHYRTESFASNAPNTLAKERTFTTSVGDRDCLAVAANRWLRIESNALNVWQCERGEGGQEKNQAYVQGVRCRRPMARFSVNDTMPSTWQLAKDDRRNIVSESLLTTEWRVSVAVNHGLSF
jgi:hypothetical protein